MWKLGLVFPNVSFAQAKIDTVWLGASGAEVEQFVTRKIEEEIDDVRGIDRIVSFSQRDLSLIDVKFREDITRQEYERAYQDLRAALDRVEDLPDEAEEPRLAEQTVNEIYPLVQINIVDDEDFADDPARELIVRAVGKEICRRVQEIDDVLRVADYPLRERELTVLVDGVRLEAVGLTILDLKDAAGGQPLSRSHIAARNEVAALADAVIQNLDLPHVKTSE